MSRARRGNKPRLGDLVATARLRYARVGPRKVRLVADLLRGLTVEQAEEQLAVTHRPSSVGLLTRLLKSAMSNANVSREEGSYSAGDLIIGVIDIDSGPTQTRFQPRAMGRAAVIRKRTAHVTVELYAHP